MYPVTTITSAILAIAFVVISIKIIKFRKLYKVSIGGHGHEDLKMTIRAHGNFSEYVPLTLILILCAEANNTNPVILSILALAFIVGRFCHAYAFVVNKDHFKYRVAGMILTFFCITALALLNTILVIVRCCV